jgi:hypothetical protein
MRNYQTKLISGGIHNRIISTEIPNTAGKDGLNWVTVDGGIELAKGKEILGVEGASGKVYNLFYGNKSNGTKVLFVKHGTKISYWNGSTLVNVITGLSETFYSFNNYTSITGNYTIIAGAEGIWKIHNANPASALSLYVDGINYKGKMYIDKARALMVDVENDKTGLYGSYIDKVTLTTVSTENIGNGNGSQTVFTGTLAFKSGYPQANCSGIAIKLGGTQIAKDDFNGNIVATGATGVAGTINYITGAFSLTFTVAPASGSGGQIHADYQWESSNNGGITDFRYTTPVRLAGEGFIIRQDEGGDPIYKIVIGSDGAYYSAKQYSFYRLYIDSTDTKPDNQLFRKDIGIPNVNGVVSAGIGIIFMNTANPGKPQLTLLDKNPLGDSLIPVQLFPQFKFENYIYDKCFIDTWDRYIIVSCRTADSTENNILLLCNKDENTVDITDKGMNCYVKDGYDLYGGSPLTETVWKIFSVEDDDGSPLNNYWQSKDDYTVSKNLKKTRKIRVAGQIDRNQKIEVSVSYDNTDYQLIGTILGTSELMDRSTTDMIGGQDVGGNEYGGAGVNTINKFYIEFKLNPIKYETRSVQFKTLGIGKARIETIEDNDIFLYENRMPKRYRIKQNVSLDGQLSNQ